MPTIESAQQAAPGKVNLLGLSRARMERFFVEIGEKLACPRPGQHPRQIEYAEAGQCALLCDRFHGGSECGNAGDRPAEDQRVDVVRTLIRVHDFKIHEVPCDAEFVADPVSAQHVPRDPRNVERLAA